MKSISRILTVTSMLLSMVSGFAQIKHLQTATIKINGNCKKCKTTIEKAGNVKNIVSVTWNENTQIASVSYDDTQTNKDEILKRIALAGYDNENFRAPDDVYAKLPKCCQYDRAIKSADIYKTMDMSAHSNHKSNTIAISNKEIPTDTSQLAHIFSNYFLIKEALTNSDADIAASKATDLATSIKKVKMNMLATKEHEVWMQIEKELIVNVEIISKTKDLLKQRNAFAALSKNIYQLAKASKQTSPIYYMHCPMFNNGKGANWLSTENIVNNPFFGSQMSTCGNVQEVIDNKL